MNAQWEDLQLLLSLISVPISQRLEIRKVVNNPVYSLHWPTTSEHLLLDDLSRENIGCVQFHQFTDFSFLSNLSKQILLVLNKLLKQIK